MVWWTFLGAQLAVASALGGEGLAERQARGAIRVEPPAAAERPTVVLANGTVWTAAGQRYARGYVIVQNGRLTGVGEGDAPVIEGATVIDVANKFVTPGLIDTHSHLGVYPMPGGNASADGNEATAPTTPGVWAEHSVWPQDPGFELAIASSSRTYRRAARAG
jgi:imidazolonepropionase-like amidohydrolase